MAKGGLRNPTFGRNGITLSCSTEREKQYLSHKRKCAASQRRGVRSSCAEWKISNPASPAYSKETVGKGNESPCQTALANDSFNVQWRKNDRRNLSESPSLPSSPASSDGAEVPRRISTASEIGIGRTSSTSAPNLETPRAMATQAHPQACEMDMFHSGWDKVGGPGSRTGGTSRIPGANSARTAKARLRPSRKDDDASPFEKLASRRRSLQVSFSRTLSKSGACPCSMNETNISDSALFDISGLKERSENFFRESVSGLGSILEIRPSLIAVTEMPPFFGMRGETLGDHSPIQYPSVFLGFPFRESHVLFPNRFEMPQMRPVRDIVKNRPHLKPCAVPDPSEKQIYGSSRRMRRRGKEQFIGSARKRFGPIIPHLLRYPLRGSVGTGTPEVVRNPFVEKIRLHFKRTVPVEKKHLVSESLQ